MLKRLWKNRSLWFRILFCWVLGCGLILLDEVKQYDLRFSLRGAQTQKTAKDIAIVYFDLHDWSNSSGSSNNWLRKLKESPEITDATFWNTQVWDQLLINILMQGPRSVGVTFFFNPQLPKPDEQLRSLTDPRVFWAAQLDQEGHVSLPLMANAYGYNVGLVDLRLDEDNLLRRFSVPQFGNTHLALKLVEASTTSTPMSNEYFSDSRLINFRGNKGLYPFVTATDVLQGRAPKDFFKNKIVLIGSNSIGSHQFITPEGRMSRVDVLAQVVDNVQNKLWISRLSFPLSCLYLLVILLLGVAVLLNYPQSVAFVFLVWLGLGTTAFSLWIFDTFCFWIPAYSPLALIALSYVVFISYQLAIKQNQTWRLEQEKRILSELDQLRNNFVSLISHDLKTPIAKIQAICDRLLAGNPVAEVRDGLQSVRKESVELHRYIQSILQISRLESNEVKLRKEATDLNEVVGHVIEQLKPFTVAKNQVVEADLEPLFSIEVDPILIHEVVLNLLENAVKYTPDLGHIKLTTREVEDRVIFAVEDSGPGIPKGDHEQLFQKFFRGQAQLGQVKGTGLGLFLVKYFIEMHGGEVFLESEVGKGTRVGFTLPLEA
jgi:two-component system phosphate regulon sensor histidine kinase PhoR